MAFPIFSLLATAGNAIANGLSSRRANRINQKNYEEVRRFNRPEMQMGRFRSAGLNPHLIYSQQNTAEQRPEWRSPQFDLSPLANAPAELATYQNITESKSRVDNLIKQNNLLDQQIISLTIENRFKKDFSRKQLEYLDKQIKQIDKTIENIDFEQEFKNRSLNNDTIKALWNFALQYATIGLHQQEFELDKLKFDEFKRQFNLTHKGSAFFDEFIKNLTGSQGADAIRVLAKALAEMFLSGFSS